MSIKQEKQLARLKAQALGLQDVVNFIDGVEAEIEFLPSQPELNRAGLGKDKQVRELMGMLRTTLKGCKSALKQVETKADKVDAEVDNLIEQLPKIPQLKCLACKGTGTRQP